MKYNWVFFNGDVNRGRVGYFVTVQKYSHAEVVAHGRRQNIDVIAKIKHSAEEEEHDAPGARRFQLQLADMERPQEPI